MLRACETVFACKRRCALQARRGLHSTTRNNNDRGPEKCAIAPAGRMRSETPATPCSDLTQWVTLIEGKKVIIHAASQFAYLDFLSMQALLIRIRNWQKFYGMNSRNKDLAVTLNLAWLNQGGRLLKPTDFFEWGKHSCHCRISLAQILLIAVRAH